MPKLTKLEKAQRLVELTGAGISEREFNSSTPQTHIEFRRTLEEDSRKLQAELRAKHLSDEQLDELLAFYDSEMGRSILESNKLVRAEFSERYSELGRKASKLEDDDKLGSLRLRVEEWQERDDDT